MKTQWLWQKVDAAPMRLMVLGIGATIAARAVHLTLFTEHLEKAALLFPYWGFGWLPRLPGALATPFLFAIAWCMVWAISNRPSSRYGAILGWLGFTYYFLLDAAFYGHMNYALIWFGLALIVAPPVMRDGDRVPAWLILAPRVLFAVIYFFAGVVKLYPEWLDGTVLLIFMQDAGMSPGLYETLSQEPLPSILAIAGALFDLTIGPLLLIPKTRRYAVVVALMFHTGNTILVGLGFLPLVFSVLTLAVFLDPGWGRKLLGWKEDPPEPIEAEPPPIPVRVALGALLLFHLVMPLRPYIIYPGDSRWTHDAQHFSWWLRSTATKAKLKVYVVSLETPRQEVEMLDYITMSQGSMAHTPRMLVHFARFLAEERRARGETGVRVYVDVEVSLNGREYRRFIPDVVDLATVEDTYSMEHLVEHEYR